MYFTGIVTLIVASFMISSALGGFKDCTTSAVCPVGSVCAFGSCTSCSSNAEKCLVSVEICDSLHCAPGEGCYLETKPCSNKVTLTAKAVCAKAKPCDSKKCKSGDCFNFDNGIHPPTAACLCGDPCDDITCPDKKRCFFRNIDNNGDPCAIKPQCVSVPECDDCGSLRPCILDINAVGKIFGRCNDDSSHFDDGDESRTNG